MPGISEFNINIKEITDVAERDIATKAAEGIKSPGVAAESAQISKLIDVLRQSKSRDVVDIANKLGIELLRAVTKAVGNLGPELSRSLTQTPQKKGRVTTEQRPLAQRKERVVIPSQTRTAEAKSLISSSEALMSQIQKDFINFKINFAKAVKSQLTSAHGEAFQVIGKGAKAYTKRGGVEILKIANMDMLITALKHLANVSEKDALQLAREKGPGELVKKASRAAMQEFSGELGETKPEQTGKAIEKITKHINKHGYEGLNKGVQKIIGKLKPEAGGVTEEQVRTSLLTKKGGAAVSQTKLQDLLAETAGRTRIHERIGAAIQEIEIPRPQKGPQGFPAIRMQSGRQRMLTSEYRFTPGMMVASRKAQQIIGAGGEEISRRREIVGKVEKAAPELPKMILKDQKAALGEHSSNIMEVMKTDKKGRLELVDAYRETITSKGKKVSEKPELKTKQQQLRYLDELSLKAKKLSIGFDDVLVAFGKLSQTGIYDRLLDSLTKESVGVTSPLRTTVQSLSDVDEGIQSVKTFNRRAREPFVAQELIEEDKPRLPWYQSQTAKVNVPKLAKGTGGIVSGEEQREELVAHNRELEKFSNLKKNQMRLSSWGIGESRSVKMEPDVTDPSRQRMNVFGGDIWSTVPGGELAGVSRPISSTMHFLGGGKRVGGKATEGLEFPLLKTKESRALEEKGMWGPPPEKGGGYGLNLQTVIADSANTFEDQIDITGKAVNRFAKYITPMIKDVSGEGGVELASKDIVSKFAPEVGRTLRMKGAEEEGVSEPLISDVSKVLTGAGGQSLEAVAVKVVEKLFTALGTKMSTMAGTKGVVTFKEGGEEGALGTTKRPAFTHELLRGMLEKKGEGLKGVKGKGAERARGEIDTAIADLDKAGTAPFVSFMHKDLPTKVQKKYKEIRDSIQKILGIDLTVSPETISSIRSMAKKQLGAKAMTKEVPTEVRMGLTGAVKRLNLVEPMQAMINNVAGNVEATMPKLTPEQRGPTGEVSQYLQAMGYGWGPEAKKPMKERTLPMYSKSSTGEEVIAGSTFWGYPREPGHYEEWSEKQIEQKRKGQKLNVAAMSALTSTFGEGAAVTQEAMAGYKPRTGQALENIMALRTLGEEPIKTKAPYIPTTGMKELPGVITKHEDLRDTILDIDKFGAGGFAEIPEFEEGKEIGKRPLYIPSRASIGMYEEAGGGASANKVAAMYGSLLTNVEKYKGLQEREYPEGEKADVGIVRKNVKAQVGKTSSALRDMLDKVTGGGKGSVISGDDLKNLINYFKQVENIIKSSVASGDVGVEAMATPAGTLLGNIKKQVGGLQEAGRGKGAGKWEASQANKLLRAVKDSLLEPKLDVKNIERTEADLEKMRTGRPLTDLSSKAYYYHKEGVQKWKKKEFTTEQFEADTPKVREWVKNSLNSYLKTLTAGEGRPGLLSVSEGAVGEAAKQFGVTTDVKEQSLEEGRKAIERDKKRLKKELVTTTIGKGKGAEILQTRTIPAITGTLSAAINTKVEDFKGAAEIIKSLGAEGILGDTSGLMNALETQTKKHEVAVEKEAAGGRVVLREGEVGLPAAKLEKLKGDYGEIGKNLLDAVRAGEDVPVMTTRFPMTGVASHQFLKAREITHPGGRDIVSLAGAAPGIDAPEIKKIIGKLETHRTALREKRAGLATAEPGTAEAKNLDARRAQLTNNINQLSKAIDLVTVKFTGFAQNADVDGDTLMVHAGKTKAAQKEIAGVERTHRTGMYGKAGALDPRAFINQMMNYNVKAQTASMADLAGLYTSKAKLPVARLFQTPELTKEMPGVSKAEVMAGLAKFEMTPKAIEKIAAAKGLTEPGQVETVARETLYEKTRAQQLGKLYVKTGLGESTEAISRVARFMESSVGFGEKQITKPEYAAWKPESVALGAVYGKGGALTQAAKPGREMQTMMNVLLEQVINQAMSAKGGGKAAFKEVTQGMASGTLFRTMEEDAKLPKKDQRFKGILEANEVIKTTIRDRLDALNSVDFLAEVRRMSPGPAEGRSDKELLSMRRDITDTYADELSFKGFLGATSKDIQKQVLKTAEGKPKQEAAIKRQIGTGELDLGMYFPQMQKGYSLRTSTASIEKFAAQVKKGKTTLDKAITKVMGIIKETGAGVSVSDVMMKGAFKNMFGMFQKAEHLGTNLGKIFKGAKTAKQKRRAVGGLERRLGIPAMPAVEQQMIKEEGARLYRKERPEAGEKEIAEEQEKHLFRHRKRAIEQHVKGVGYKKELMFGVAPIVGEQYRRQRAEEQEYAEFTRRKTRKKAAVPVPSSIKEIKGLKDLDKAKLIEKVKSIREVPKVTPEDVTVESFIGEQFGEWDAEAGKMAKKIPKPKPFGKPRSYMGVAYAGEAIEAGQIKKDLQDRKAEEKRRKTQVKKDYKAGFKIYGPQFEEDIPDLPGLPETAAVRGITPAITSRELETLKRTQIQTYKQAGVRQPKRRIEEIAGMKPAEAKISEAKAVLEGGAKGVDYAAVGDIPAPELVKKLQEYTKSLNLLVNGATGVTTQQTAKIQKALIFVKQNLGALEGLPGGTKLGKAAGAAVSAYRTIGQEDLLTRSITGKGGIPLGGLPPGKPPTGEPSGPPEEEKPKRPLTSKYKTELEALTNLVAAAGQRTGYTPEGLPESVTGTLESVRGKQILPHLMPLVPDLLTKSMETAETPFPRQKTVWSQYQLEKVRGELDVAQKAEEAGDVTGREEAIRRAKTQIVRSYGVGTTPFLTKEEGGRGRVSGYADEEAIAKLGIYRKPEERERVLQRVDIKSETAGKAVAPVLMGTERMEQRLKTMWARVREFNPELAKAGKAFDFTNAKKDLAIIKEELKSFRRQGMFSPEEYSDLDHAVREVTKMEKAVQEAPEKGLPTLAIPGLETKETAEAAYENLLAATEKEMLADKDLAVGAKRKVAFKIPTEGGLIERRETTLVARGAKEGLYAPGVVGGIERVKGKPTVEREEIISRRSIRLLKEFEGSTKRINEKIKQVWLGIKKFDKAAGSVDFNEALKDLSDMHMMLTEMLKVPGLPAGKQVEYSQLRRKMGTAIRTMAETPAEGMEGVIMKGMETPESAKVAFRKQIEAQKAALWEREDLVPGQALTVAATIPTAAGVEQKRQVQLRAVGEKGVVTGIEERKFRTAKEYARELRTEGKTTRAKTLVSQFMEGAGDVNKRISKMVLGIKRFDEGLAKAGKHTKAINFDTAEKDLVRVIKLLDEALKGAVHLTEEERAAYKQAQLAAKAMYQKVVKTPAGMRKGISMAGYETPASSLAAHRAKIEEESRKLIESGVRGKSILVQSRLMTEGGGEVPIAKRLTARGAGLGGFTGRVSRVAEREEVGGGQVGSVIRRVALWGSASGLIYGILGGARQMLQTMKQAETGLVNLKKVMSHVTTDFDHMRDSAVRFAKDYGAELMGVLETMRIFAQQGLPQEQVKEMARVSTLAANVTTMKPTEAAEALTSATRQFNIEGEKSIAILDSWNEVENKFAITAKDLADGFKKAGTAAKITGIDVHKLNGIITAIGEATRQTGKEVGTSLKFILSRMATEKAPKALTAVGVETMEGGRLREGSAVLDDLAKRWVTLTRAQKLATAQAIGGIRHYNALMVMMANYHRALAATAASINSVGSAEKENKMIMETYEKKVAQMKASFDALAVSASGPILAALGSFVSGLKEVLEVMTVIPNAALAAGGALAYMGATGLGKYFDLSMFGLLGSSVGGATRKRRGPRELITAPFRGKREVGEALFKRKTPAERISEKWSRRDKELRAISRSGGVSLGPPLRKIDLAKKGFYGLGNAIKTAFFAVTGLVASMGMLGKIIAPVAILGATFYFLGKSVSKTFASAKDRTKDYTKSLDAVEERLNAIGAIKLLRTRVEIETERIGALEARTPEQRAAQIEGRSYKSPMLMRKQQIVNIKEYAGAVAAMTSKGIVGFDRFGKAIISSTEDLGKVVDELEAIGSKARLELKLHIGKEELEDLTKAPEIDSWIKVIHYKFRELLERMSKEWGTDWLGKYADRMRNPFEAVLHSMKEINKLRREAGAYGEIIAPPSEKLKEKDPEKYERVKKRFDEYTKAQTEHLNATKTINEKFLEVRRDFFTLSGPGMTPSMAGQAAFGQTGRLLAEIEREREARFYGERGATTEDIQASFFQRLSGINVRATTEITREAAAEQGIPFQPAETMEERRGMLATARAKDILMFKEGTEIQGRMASIFERNGELWVQYSKQVVKEGEKQLIPVEQTLAQFKEMPKYAEQFIGIVSSMGMLTPTEMRLRAISRVPAGAEAGMFKPRKERRLDLGKKYTYQVPTEMLIQNDAFKTFSKTTVAFVNEYIKKQNELRRQQKAALSVYEKRGAIAGETATQIELLTAELVKLSNVAMQSVRIHIELEKALDQLNVTSAQQEAVQKFRSENLKHLTGPLAGTPILRVPKIDIRMPSDLTPHERLARTSKDYVSNVQELGRATDKYNVAIKKGELATKALTDIEYVKGLAAEGVDFGNIDELAKKISKTGDVGSALVVSELEKQTALGQQTVSNLSSVVNLLGAGAGAYAKAAKMPYGIDRKIEMASAMETVKTQGALALSRGDYDKFIEQFKTLTETNKLMSIRETHRETYRGTTPEQAAELDKFFMSQTKTEETPSFRIGMGEIHRGFADMILEQLAVNPDQMKKYVVGAGVLTGEGFEEKREAGALGEIFKGKETIATPTGPVEREWFKEFNVVALINFIETLSKSEQALSRFNEELGKEAIFMSRQSPAVRAGLQEKVFFQPEEATYREPEDIFDFLPKQPEVSYDRPLTPTELAERVEGEATKNVKRALTASQKEIIKYAEVITGLSLPLAEAQKAVKNFDKASGNLQKTVEHLAESFRDLERQSVINQKLIKLRAEYLSTRGGPMKRTAPSVNIDVGTTAGQYSPHQVLYERSSQYKKTTDEYLKTAEVIKAARSKMELVETVRAKAEFMETQGVSKERIESIVTAALETGSIETGRVVTELGTLNETAKAIENRLAGKEEKIGGEEQKKVKSLTDLFKEFETTNKAAEKENIERANYMRGRQLRQQTREDVVAGRGKSLDQITREENVWRAKIGHVPSEIKERNKKLLQVYEAEKEARATFELEKRKILEPMQQSVSGMKSIIDSIKTGLSGIMGGRNVRPLETDFAEWSKRQGTGEMAQERIAEQSAQFNLAKSLYSQNLGLRAQGVDTGVRPRELYDIMEKASRGEDITGSGGPFAKFIGGAGGGPLQAIQERLSKAMEAKEAQIREVQAEEYATAMRGAMGSSENKLDSIKDNTGKLITSGESVGNSIVDAVNALRDAGLTVNIPGLKISGTGGDVGVSYAGPSESERQQKAGEILSATGADVSFPQKTIAGSYGSVGIEYREPELTDRQRKVQENLEAAGATVSFSTSAPSKEDIVKQQGDDFDLTMEDYIMSKMYQGYTNKPLYEDAMKQLPSKEGVPSILEIDKGTVDRKKDIEELAVKPERKTLTDSKKSTEAKQTESLLKTNKNLNTEVSDLKDEIEVLKTTVSDINKVFKEFSNNLEDVNSIGEASKDSAALIEDLGQSASDASTSLDTLSTKMSTFDVSEGETGPTAREESGFEYISEEDAITMVNGVKDELSERIEQLSGDSETVESLVENVRILSEDVEVIKTNIPAAPEGTTSTDDFNAFKEEVSSYFETVNELKELIDDLDIGVTKNTASVLGLESGFELINKKLQDHDSNIVELQRNLSTMDAKFSEAISALREEVAEAKDLAWSAYTFATQK